METIMDLPPVLRLILCGFVMGIGGGLFNGIKKHKSAVPSVLQKTCYVVGAILEFAPLLIVLPSLFDCLGNGLGLLFNGILGAFAALFLGVFIVYFPLRSVHKRRMRKNKILTEAVKLAKQQDAAAVVLCHDGIRICKDFIPPAMPKPSKKCATQLEYDTFCPVYTSYHEIRAFSKTDDVQYTDIDFRARGFSSISYDDADVFLEVLSKTLKRYKPTIERSYVSYETPSYSYQTGSSYYTSNGNLHGSGSSTHYVEGNEQKKLADFVLSAVRKDLLKKKKVSAKPEFKEKW